MSDVTRVLQEELDRVNGPTITLDTDFMREVNAENETLRAAVSHVMTAPDTPGWIAQYLALALAANAAARGGDAA